MLSPDFGPVVDLRRLSDDKALRGRATPEYRHYVAFAALVPHMCPQTPGLRLRGPRADLLIAQYDWGHRGPPKRARLYSGPRLCQARPPKALSASLTAMFCQPRKNKGGRR